MDNSEAYIRQMDLIPMEEEDYIAPKVICAAADFAVSKADKANRTAFVIGGMTINNVIHYMDCRVDRWATDEWIEEMFNIQSRWNPEVFWVEDGVIWLSIAPTLYNEMQRRGVWINCQPRKSIKDKATRGRSFQKRTRGGGCRFDKQSEWYPGFENEILKFTGHSDATLDDQFDAAALLSLGFETMDNIEEDDLLTEEELEHRESNPLKNQGRNTVTGY